MKSAHVIILVYKILNNSSIQEIVNYAKQLKETRPSGVPIIVVGTKLDLKGSIRRCSTHSLLTNLDEDTRHLLTSSKNNIGVTDVFEFCLDEFIKRDPTSVASLSNGDVPSSKNKTVCCHLL